MSDGDLRQKFRDYLGDAIWTPIETMTGRGVPDVEFCFRGGASGWIENKRTLGWTVDMRTEQIAWAEQRARYGGASFVAVRQIIAEGPRRGAAVDRLWLFGGRDARRLRQGGLLALGVVPLVRSDGGAAAWDWQAVRKALSRPVS